MYVLKACTSGATSLGVSWSLILELMDSRVVHPSVSEQKGGCLCVRAPCIRALPSSALYSSLTSLSLSLPLVLSFCFLSILMRVESVRTDIVAVACGHSSTIVLALCSRRHKNKSNNTKLMMLMMSCLLKGLRYCRYNVVYHEVK
jgi:hypothetical protein